MILQQLTLHDFCLFRGEQTFDLAPATVHRWQGAPAEEEIVPLLPAANADPADLSVSVPCGGETKVCGGRLAWRMPALACPCTKGRCLPCSCGGVWNETNATIL